MRVNLQPRGAQHFDIGGNAPAVVDASGRFTITAWRRDVTRFPRTRPGRRAGRRGRGRRADRRTDGQASERPVHVALVAGHGVDVLDFPVDVEPNQDLTGVVLTFGDRTQELSGTIQDPSGRPTFDYTIILFAADNRYWPPQSRRITSTRPGTDGKFTIRGIPAGEYRLTAVTDVDTDEWFNPAFLEQVMSASIPVSIRDGEKKTQDIRVQGGQN